MDHVNNFDRLQAVRVAGAMAHELNNPLQGILSQLTLASDECGGNELLKQRMLQLEGGVQRLSKAVQNFSALYENLPRNPDLVAIDDLIRLVDSDIRSRGFLTTGADAVRARSAVCMGQETARLFPEVAIMPAASGQQLTWTLDEQDKTIALRLTCGSSGDQAHWKAWDEIDGLSGIPVLLDEITKLAGGRMELQWQGDTWIGTAIVLMHI